jgi:hypothetical protein
MSARLSSLLFDKRHGAHKGRGCGMREERRARTRESGLEKSFNGEEMMKLHAVKDPKRAPRAKGGAKHWALHVRAMNRVRAVVSCAIPLWAAGFGWLGGSLLHAGSYELAAGAYGFVSLIYIVSLPHVVSGLRKVLNSTTRDAVCLGIVTDLALVGSETLIHFGSLNTVGVVIATMCAALGGALACYANFVSFNGE